jgi:hypothetical protein
VGILAGLEDESAPSHHDRVADIGLERLGDGFCRNLLVWLKLWNGPRDFTRSRWPGSAVHILDGLLKNRSEIQPDTLHAEVLSVFTPTSIIGCVGRRRSFMRPPKC